MDFRIADTFEDAELWPRERKLDALARFGRLLLRPAPDEARREADGWLAEPPSRACSGCWHVSFGDKGN